MARAERPGGGRPYGEILRASSPIEASRKKKPSAVDLLPRRTLVEMGYVSPDRIAAWGCIQANMSRRRDQLNKKFVTTHPL